MVEPTGNAKFVEFVTACAARDHAGVRLPVLEWPYVEGLRIDEAMHPLTIMSVGLYDRVLPNQNGAPIRLVVPWKYGFKSSKSIVRIRFVVAAAEDRVGEGRRAGVRLLLQRESRGGPSALEPGAPSGASASSASARRCRSTATATRSPRCTPAWT